LGKAAFAPAQSLCRGSCRASNATVKAGLSELGAEQIDCRVARAVGWQDSLDAQLARRGVVAGCVTWFYPASNGLSAGNVQTVILHLNSDFRIHPNFARSQQPNKNPVKPIST
jgi:hypothetical protein